jgi:MFS family permease
VLVSIIPGVLGVLALAFGAQDIPPRPRTPTEQPKLTFGALSREFKIFLGILAIFTLGNSADAFIVLRAQERGLTVAGVLGMLITFNLVYSALSTPLGSLSDRIGRERLLIGGWLVYGVLYLGFAFATEAWHIWLIYTLYGVYYAAVEGTAKAFIADLIPSEQRGTAYGYYNATIGLMALPASFLAGLLWQSIAPNAPFLLGSGLALIATLLLWRWRGSTHPKSH